MRLESLLPLGKVDPGLRAPETGLDLASVPQEARILEEAGWDAVVLEETKQDPYVVLALAAQATQRLGIGTSVAMAFPRSPTVTALSAWTLQNLSRGRFRLGLGPQVRAHIERRYGMTWSPPAPWMREYVEAVRAVWRCWQQQAPLDFKGRHYAIDLMPPLFDPGPIEHPHIPIHLAAVNRAMCRVAGAVADGVRPHPICSADYIANVMIPEIRAGAAAAGRPLDGFEISHKPLIATAADAGELARRVEDIRARLAFYLSTPAYRPAADYHGLGDLARELSRLARERDWEKMPNYVSDAILDLYAVVATHDEIAAKLCERFAGVVTSCEFSIAVRSAANRERLALIARDVHAYSLEAVRGRLAGSAAPER
jgi:probable F420-dependent oxidoreductase